MSQALAGRTTSSATAAETTTDGVPRKPKQVVIVFLTGAASHHETFDMKPGATAKIRGDFNPIATKIPRLRHQRTPASPGGPRRPLLGHPHVVSQGQQPPDVDPPRVDRRKAARWFLRQGGFAGRLARLRRRMCLPASPQRRDPDRCQPAHVPDAAAVDLARTARGVPGSQVRSLADHRRSEQEVVQGRRADIAGRVERLEAQGPSVSAGRTEPAATPTGGQRPGAADERRPEPGLLDSHLQRPGPRVRTAPRGRQDPRPLRSQHHRPVAVAGSATAGSRGAGRAVQHPAGSRTGTPTTTSSRRSRTGCCRRWTGGWQR